MAARAEGANKEADTTMLITENAYQQIEERVEVEDFIRTKVKGTSERITLHEIKSIIGESLVAKNHDALVEMELNGRKQARAKRLRAIKNWNLNWMAKRSCCSDITARFRQSRIHLHI